MAVGDAASSASVPAAPPAVAVPGEATADAAVGTLQASGGTSQAAATGASVSPATPLTGPAPFGQLAIGACLFVLCSCHSFVCLRYLSCLELAPFSAIDRRFVSGACSL